MAAPAAMTSDQVAFNLTNRAPSADWHLIPLDVERVDNVANLMTYRALGRKAEFVMPAMRVGRAVAAGDIIPLVLAPPPPQPHRAPPLDFPSSSSGAHSPAQEAPNDAAVDEQEYELAAGAPVEEAMNMLDVVMPGFAVMAGHAEPDDEVHDDGSQDGGGECDPGAAAVPAELNDVLGGDPASGPAAADLTPEDLAKACWMTPRGDVFCSALPWRNVGKLGRLTQFPWSLPPEQQTLSVKCYMHGCSFLIPRRMCTDEDVLRWLMSGERPDTDNELARLAAKERHAEQWREFRSFLSDR